MAYDKFGTAGFWVVTAAAGSPVFVELEYQEPNEFHRGAVADNIVASSLVQNRDGTSAVGRRKCMVNFMVQSPTFVIPGAGSNRRL